jgi:tetratricopeptide (TPR) repeat protein
MNIGRYADAAADLDRFAARQPHTRIAALYRAKCALLQGQGAAARGFLDRAAKLPFGDTEHVTTRIYSYFSDAEFYAFRSLADLLLGRNDAALADFKITVKAQAKNEGPIMNDICHIGGVAGLFDFAVLACQESIATQWVDSSRPYANLAYIQLREHKWADAITNETKALAREGGYTPALYGRGIARIASGARSSGEADLARARAREPDIDTIMASLHAPTEATLADPAADAAANPAQAIRQPDTTQQGLVDLAPVHVSPH